MKLFKFNNGFENTIDRPWFIAGMVCDDCHIPHPAVPAAFLISDEAMFLGIENAVNSQIHDRETI